MLLSFMAGAMVWAVAPLQANAATVAPRWTLNVVAQPTQFSAADSGNEKLVVAIEATGGDWTLGVKPPGTPNEEVESPWDATHEQLQATLEALPDIGAGNVMVAGGPGDENGTSPYEITFDGARSGMFMAPSVLNGTLTGGDKKVIEREGAQLPHADDRYRLTAVNVGGAKIEGEVTLVLTELPTDLVLDEMSIEEPTTGTTGSCSPAEGKCTYEASSQAPISPGGELVVNANVAVPSPSISGPLLVEGSVSGGNAAAGASARLESPVNTGTAGFGIEQFAMELTDTAGVDDTQAGGHPYRLATRLDLNTNRFTGNTVPSGEKYAVAQEVKDVSVELPLGMVGDPLAAERCPEIDLTHDLEQPLTKSYKTLCPAGSMIGTARLVDLGSGRPTSTYYGERQIVR